MGDRRIEDHVRSVLERSDGNGVIAAYLFGSRGRGESRPESDIDLGLLLDHDLHPRAEDRFALRLRWISLLESPEGPSIDLVILNDVHPSLGRAIATDGVLLFCTDAEKNHSWVRNVQLMAADLDPFLDRMRRIKLEALTQ